MHPRFEIYCKPEDVRLLLGKDEKVKNIDGLQQRIKDHGLDNMISADVLSKLGDGFSKDLYYFKQKHSFEGWNADTHEVIPFQSHVVFQDKPYDQQYVFGAGQENWWGQSSLIMSTLKVIT